jgi:hypothetical protein
VIVIIGLIARSRFVAPVAVHPHVVDQGDVVREVFGRRADRGAGQGARDGR